MDSSGEFDGLSNQDAFKIDDTRDVVAARERVTATRGSALAFTLGNRGLDLGRVVASKRFP